MSKVTVAGGGGGGGGGGIPPMPGTKVVKMPDRVSFRDDTCFIIVKLETDSLPIPPHQVKFNILVVIDSMNTDKVLDHYCLSVGINGRQDGNPYATVHNGSRVRSCLGFSPSVDDSVPVYASYHQQTKEIEIRSGLATTEILDAYFIMLE